MAIDDNSWDAGYEAGIRDQKKADAEEIAALQLRIDELEFLAAHQRNHTAAVIQTLRERAGMLDQK